MKVRTVYVATGQVSLEGDLSVPDGARGVVLFAHGSGSSRHSSRNRFVARILQECGLATLLIDLLTQEEEHLDSRTGELRFDIPMLAERLRGAIDWLALQPETKRLRVGLFGASTGAGAALIAASRLAGRIGAVISRGGRADLAGESLGSVTAPTLLIVGGLDYPVIEMNRWAYERLRCEKKLEIVPGATHLFEEEGTLEIAARLAANWLVMHLKKENTPAPERTHPTDPTSRLIAIAAEPFIDVEEADLDPLMERVGDARIVLIGEATHGTSEFYRMRQRITRELIRRKGFNILAVEADWPDAEHVDEYVRLREPKRERVERAFDRFPDWMWRNREVLDFIDWLRRHNSALTALHDRVAFYGLDMYSLFTSIQEVLRYLAKVDPGLAEVARERYECLMPFQADPGLYGSAVVHSRYDACREEVTAMLKDLFARRLEYRSADGLAFFDASQNARVVASAEEYYRLMYMGSNETWNLRDTHMFETLVHLLSFHGSASKAVVWAHNSHVGNARATSMGAWGETNIGELVQERFRGPSYTIGFGTHTGTVAAASTWGGNVEIKTVRPSREGSYELLCHGSGVRNFLLPLRDGRRGDLRDELSDQRLERAIGVIYRPDTELRSHYFQAVLPEQFDEYIWFDESTAVRPMKGATTPALPGRHPFLLVD